MTGPTRRTGQRVVLTVTSAQSLRLMNGFPEYLAARGWDVHVVVSEPPPGAYAEGSGVVVHDLAMTREPSPRRDLTGLIAWLRLLGRLRPSIVLAGTPKAALLAMVAAFLTRTPNRVYLLRGLRLETESGLRGRLLWILEWLTARAATRVLAVSMSLRGEFLARHLCPPDKIAVLGSGSSNGVDTMLRPEHHAVTAIEQALGLGDAELVVGFVGRISVDKGIGTLFSAVRLLEQRGEAVRLLLVGAEEPPGILAQSLAASGVDPALVSRVGAVPDPTPYYGSMDVLCLPTRREGFPNVVLEAAVQGVPSVATTATGSIDAVVDGVTGLMVSPDDPRALAEALRALRVDRDRCRRLGVAARRRAADLFDREMVWSRTEEYLLDMDKSETWMKVDEQ